VTAIGNKTDRHKRLYNLRRIYYADVPLPLGVFKYLLQNVAQAGAMLRIVSRKHWYTGFVYVWRYMGCVQSGRVSCL